MKNKPYHKVTESIQQRGRFKVVLYSGKRKAPGRYLIDDTGYPTLFKTYGQAERAGQAAVEEMNV